MQETALVRSGQVSSMQLLELSGDLLAGIYTLPHVAGL
jgi:hypothetical protein